jgi:hypothetical protein
MNERIKVEYLALAICGLDSEDRYALAKRLVQMDDDAADSLACCIGFALQDAAEERDGLMDLYYRTRAEMLESA